MANISAQVDRLEICRSQKGIKNKVNKIFNNKMSMVHPVITGSMCSWECIQIVKFRNMNRIISFTTTVYVKVSLYKDIFDLNSLYKHAFSHEE